MRVHLPLHLFVSAALGVAVLGNAPHAAAASTPTTATLAITSGGSAVTTVSSGAVVTLTATVVAGTTPVTPGLVTFCDAAAAHCTDIHIVGTAQLTSAGTATYKFRPGVGSHSYYSVFAGTPNGVTAYAGSTSSTAALSVTGLWPSITSLAVSPGTTSGTFNFTATVGGNGNTALTGTVSFLDASSGDSVLGTAMLGAGTAGLSFLNASDPGDSQSLYTIAVGDFNGDGIPDLAVTDGSNNTVMILLGNGDGTFTATPTSPSTGSSNYYPYKIAAADFNGDGILDLAVTNFPVNGGTAGNLTVLLGNGDGTFAPVAASPAVGSQPFSIAVADLNGDGIPDLAVVNQCGNDPANCVPGTVTILLGNGDGTFAPAKTQTVGCEPHSIMAGDFNGDGIPDLAVVNSCYDPTEETASTVTVLLGDGTGNFTPVTTLISGLSLGWATVGDFNGDGILDFAATGGNPPSIPDEVAVFLGNGDGTFTQMASIPATGLDPYSIAVGDFNADGVADLAVADYSTKEVTVLLGDGTGNFTPTSVPPYADYAYFVAVGDFNGDGVSDLAVSSLQNVTILEAATQTATATISGIVPAAPSDIFFGASYPGDSSYSGSTSTIVSPSGVQVTPTVTVMPSSSGILTTQSLTVTVAVNGGAGSPTAGGFLTLTSGSYTSANTFLTGGSAQISIPAGSLAVGSDTLTATYTPDLSSPYYSSATGKSTISVEPPATLTPSSGTLAASQTFTWNNGVGVTEYKLRLGTEGPGTDELYGSGPTFGTSATVSIPSDGITVFATLEQLIGGVWVSTPYTFTEPGTAAPATLTPSSGTLATSETFSWSNGVGPAEYKLWLGTLGPGTSDLYGSGVKTKTSVTVTIPSNGVTVFATLWQLIDGTWQSTPYTFTEPGTLVPATLTPLSGTLAASQTFTWVGGVGPAEYKLRLGTTPGANNIYASGPTLKTSVTVSIPSNGATMYATLYQLIDGAWQTTPYTFTEP